MARFRSTNSACGFLINYNMACEPTITATLLKFRETDHVLVLVLHELIADAESLDIIFQDLAKLYPAITRRSSPPMPVLQFQYADFARWQVEEAAKGALDEHLSF